MNLTVFVTFWLIVLARIIDVSLDTVRMVSVVQGRRGFAAILGFFQALVFICAVAKVLLNMSEPAYAIAYAVGFATGTYLGMLIEQRLAFGRQLVFLVTAKGPQLAAALDAAGYRVAEVKAHTQNGDLTIICVEILRREAQKLIRLAGAVDEQSVVIVHNIHRPEFARGGAPKAKERRRSRPFSLGGLASLKKGIS